MHTTTLYRDEFDATRFRRWPDAEGQWIATEPVHPTSVVPMPDLVRAHEAAAIDLRTVTDLHEFRARALRGPWQYSIVRLTNAGPVSDPQRRSEREPGGPKRSSSAER